MSNLRDVLSVLDGSSDAFIRIVNSLGDQINQSALGKVLQNIELTLSRNFQEVLLGITTWYKDNRYHGFGGKMLELPLMNPFHVCLIILTYLILVYGGMALMKHMKPLELRWYAAVHNLGLTLLSLYMFVEITRQAWMLGYSWVGNTGLGIPEEAEMTKILWIFYFSKVPEMVDTLIMVLKKNFHQVTFLHVYHHCSIFMIWWLVVYSYPCGDSYFSSAQNSLVHVFMYSYYFLTTFKIPVPWKFYITYMQMFQFAMNITQASYYLFVLKAEPALPMQILLSYCLSLFILFGNFLFQSKNKPKQKCKAD